VGKTWISIMCHSVYSDLTLIFIDKITKLCPTTCVPVHLSQCPAHAFTLTKTFSIMKCKKMLVNIKFNNTTTEKKIYKQE